MTQVPDDELISAYLDGELSGEDLLRAEQLLATRPESRQLLEDLTALRASLQSLPRQSLGPGFADHVLRRAEREILRPATGIAATAAPVITEGAPPRVLSRQRWRRPLIWSGLAVAAALLIMAFSPENQEVAMVPAPPGGELTASPEPAGDLARNNAAEGAPAVAAAPMAAPALAPSGAEPDSQAAAGANPKFDVASENVLVVEADVTAPAAAQDALRQLLAKNQIAWEAIPGDESGNGQARAEAPLARSLAKPELPEQGQQSADKSATGAIYIVAEPRQLQAAVDSLSTNAIFRNVRAEQMSAPADMLALYDEEVGAAMSLKQPSESATRDRNEPAGERNPAADEVARDNAAAQPTTTDAAAGEDQKQVAQQKSPAMRAYLLQKQNQLGRARQLPLADVQLRLQAGGQQLTVNEPAKPGQNPAPPADRKAGIRLGSPSTQVSPPAENAQATRALIILHVAPESAPATAPPAEPVPE